eukprot:7709958-Heterocapsa_arctica.AAC.1
MTKAEKEDREMENELAEKVEKSEDVAKADADAKYQDFIMRKLGKLSHSLADDQFIVDHELQVCGTTVKVPVFEMEIDG